MQISVIVYADYHNFLSIEANENFVSVFMITISKL